jgi:ribosomal protein S18 acetylase RimI-like enzyme
MEIMELKNEDIEDFKELFECSYSHGTKFDVLLVKNVTGYAEKELRSLIKDRKAKILVVSHQKKILGFIVGIIEKKPYCFSIRNVGYIWDFFVSPDFRKRGIGRKLFESMMSWFKINGLKYTEIDVDYQNKDGICIWKKFGFKGRRINMIRKI